MGTSRARAPFGFARINLLLPYLPPYPSAGSMRATSLLHGLCAERNMRGGRFSMRIYTATDNPEPMEGVDIVSLPFSFPENTVSFSRRLLAEFLIGAVAMIRILWRTRRRDLILLSSPLFIPALLAGLGAALMRRRYVLDIRDLYPLVYADAGLMSKSSLTFRFLSRLERFWIARASLVIAATGGLARHVRQAGARAPVLTFYNGYPERLAALSGTRKRERFTACFHGVLGQFQDVETVILVARRLASHGIDVVVIGYGAKARLLEEANFPNLHFMGRLPFDQTARLVSECHVGLCLRRGGEISRDAFPVKVWECLGLGLPSIVTPQCEAGEFLEAKGAGAQFGAGEVERIVDWLVKLRNDSLLYGGMVKNCIVIREQYTRERIGEQTASEIVRILDDHGGGRAAGSAAE